MVRLNHIIFERTLVVMVVPYSSRIGLDIPIIRSPKNQMIKEGKSTVDNQPRYKLSLWSLKTKTIWVVIPKYILEHSAGKEASFIQRPYLWSLLPIQCHQSYHYRLVLKKSFGWFWSQCSFVLFPSISENSWGCEMGRNKSNWPHPLNHFPLLCIRLLIPHLLFLTVITLIKKGYELFIPWQQFVST